MSYENTSTMAGAHGNDYFLVALNGCVHPMDTPHSATGFPGPSVAVNQLEPTGLGFLLNTQMFRSFVVRWAAIQFRMAVISPLDTVYAAILPNTAGTTPSVSYVDAAHMPNVTTKLFTSSNSTQWLSNSGSIATLSGIDQKAIDYDLSYNYSGTYSTAPAELMMWTIAYKWSNGSNTDPLIMEVKGQYIIEFFDQQTDLPYI